MNLIRLNNQPNYEYHLIRLMSFLTKGHSITASEENPH